MSNDKFKALVHFMVQACAKDPSRLGATRLNKALWYTDVAAFKVSGEPMSGETYIKRQMGPVPKNILKVLQELEVEGKICVEEPSYLYDTRKYISMEEPSSNLLSEDEKTLAGRVLECVCGFTASEISEMTHDVIWDAAEMGMEIPIYATLAVNQGEVTENIRAWAEDQLEEMRVG